MCMVHEIAHNSYDCSLTMNNSQHQTHPIRTTGNARYRVVKPTNHGELCCFNSNCPEHSPVSIWDIAQWIGTPSAIVIDCSDSRKIHNNFCDYHVPTMKPKQSSKKNNNNDCGNNNDDSDIDSLHEDKAEELNLYDDELILFASCDYGELVPNNPDYPADILTSCLTSPMKMAIRFFGKTSVLTDVKDEIIDLYLIHLLKVQGKIQNTISCIRLDIFIFHRYNCMEYIILHTKLFQRLFS